MRAYKIGDKKFDRVFETTLNSISPEDLSEEELDIHEQWVEDNWDDLSNYPISDSLIL